MLPLSPGLSIITLFFSTPLLNYSWAIGGKYKAVIDGWLSFPFVTMFHFSCIVLNWIIALETIPAHYFFFLKFCFQCCYDLFTCNFFLAFSFWFSFFLILLFFYFTLQTNRNFLLSSFHSLIYDKFSFLWPGICFSRQSSFKYLPDWCIIFDIFH